MRNYYDFTVHVMQSCIRVYVYGHISSNNTEYLHQLYGFCWHMYILLIAYVFVYVCCSMLQPCVYRCMCGCMYINCAIAFQSIQFYKLLAPDVM